MKSLDFIAWQMLQYKWSEHQSRALAHSLKRRLTRRPSLLETEALTCIWTYLRMKISALTRSNLYFGMDPNAMYYSIACMTRVGYEQTHHSTNALRLIAEVWPGRSTKGRRVRNGVRRVLSPDRESETDAGGSWWDVGEHIRYSMIN